MKQMSEMDSRRDQKNREGEKERERNTQIFLDPEEPAGETLL